MVTPCLSWLQRGDDLRAWQYVFQVENDARLANYVGLVASLGIRFCNVLTTNGSSQGSASNSVFGSTMKQKLIRFDVAAEPWHKHTDTVTF